MGSEIVRGVALLRLTVPSNPTSTATASMTSAPFPSPSPMLAAAQLSAESARVSRS